MLNDDEDRVASFERRLKLLNHSLLITHDAEACLKLYQRESQETFFKTDPVDHIQPFDAVVLDCDSCEVSVIEIAKEMLAVNPRQRIVMILKAEGHQNITKEFREEEKTSLDIIQKPIDVLSLVDIVELTEVYSELQKMHLDTNAIRRANFRYEQIINILNIVTRSKIKDRRRIS
jgi:DNA-binding LytR/AlgR family response regulator